MSNKFKIQLGDIIQIIAPNDIDINDQMYHVIYIDQEMRANYLSH
jgi:hypothetical protein